jgi:hypothetical protein
VHEGETEAGNSDLDLVDGGRWRCRSSAMGKGRVSIPPSRVHSGADGAGKRRPFGRSTPLDRSRTPTPTPGHVVLLDAWSDLLLDRFPAHTREDIGGDLFLGRKNPEPQGPVRGQRAAINRQRPRKASDVPGRLVVLGGAGRAPAQPGEHLRLVMTNWVASAVRCRPARLLRPISKWPITPSGCVTDSASLSPRVRAANGV